MGQILCDGNGESGFNSFVSRERVEGAESGDIRSKENIFSSLVRSPVSLLNLGSIMSGKSVKRSCL